MARKNNLQARRNRHAWLVNEEKAQQRAREERQTQKALKKQNSQSLEVKSHSGHDPDVKMALGTKVVKKDICKRKLDRKAERRLRKRLGSDVRMK